ncbi:MAG TPA: hypothetical protein DD381_03700 [Lentisphaeria bacterium]|nr:MAG: hypothetical protein A2X47_09140 [Lentisphaerae bacterium GWF2_38_69]HBM15436.1 hypothetical protein [Lentisphaeria bacterium]
MIKQISHNQKLLGIIIPKDFHKEGIEFFTSNDMSQQLAFMSHHKGHEIVPHFHNPVPRTINYTQEVLFIRKGKLRVDFYDDKQEYLESHVLEAGDVILLASGGHGFEALEDLEMFEVKQGPYIGEKCKTRFTSVSSEKIKIISDNK